MAIPCTKCNGKGTAPRQPPYNDAARYQFLAASEGSCEHCSGSCVEPVLSAREIAIRAAKQDSGS